MNVFTEVYNRSRTILQTQSLDPSWAKLQTDMKLLLGVDGFDAAKGAVLEDIRKQLKDSAKGKMLSGKAKAEEILKASKPDTHGFQDRAAMVKFLNHTYLIGKKGAQNIWVVDPPKSYRKWTYDEFSGKTKEQLKSQLNKNREVFRSYNRGVMSDALQQARKWSADVEVALSKKDEKLVAKVKRWFHDDTSTDEAVNASIAKLLDGFKKIHASCNSGQVIFSDRPHLRASGEWDNVYASVNAGDKMPVIYIFQVFLKAGRKNVFGNVPKMWLCALTVVHELTHKLVNTDDVRYDDDGLKPGKSFPPGDALRNADSWAYFAADVVGVLSKGTIKKVLS